MSLYRWSRNVLRRRLAVSGLIMIFASVCFLGVTGYQAWNILSFLPGTVSTNATITSCLIDPNPTICKPIATFKTQAGRQITIRSEQAFTLHPGDTITVWYHPASPEDARTDVAIGDIFKVLSFPLVAVVFFLLGLVLLWLAGDLDLPGLIARLVRARAASRDNSGQVQRARKRELALDGAPSQAKRSNSYAKPRSKKPYPTKRRKRR